MQGRLGTPLEVAHSQQVQRGVGEGCRRCRCCPCCAAAAGLGPRLVGRGVFNPPPLAAAVLSAGSG